MKKIIFLMLVATVSLFAKVNVVTTYSYLGEIVKKVGGDNVKVDVLASPKFDPHFIVPKPSLITKIKKADLLIINGGQLEIGWLPPLLRGAQNRDVNIGSKGFLDVSSVITMINKPKVVSRSFGDVHPDGNPHFALDPHNIGIIAKLVTQKLIILDAKNSSSYEKNLANFLSNWSIFLKEYDAKVSQCKEKKVVQYHQLFNYYFDRYGFKSFGSVEPLPGITPSSKHTLELINIMKENGVKKIIQDVYHEKKTAKFIADKTAATVVVIPHDVGSFDGSDTLESFYNTIEKRLCN